MNRRYIGLILFVLLLSAAVPLFIRLLNAPRKNAKPNIVQELNVGDGQTLRITRRPVPPLRGPRIGLYYRFMSAEEAAKTQPASSGEHEEEEKEEKEDAAFFGTVPRNLEPPRFVTHRGADGQVIAVAPASDPQAVLVLHNLSSGESWPRHGELEGLEALQTRGRRMMAQFTGAQSEAGFRLVRAEGLRLLDQLVALPAARTQPGE